MVIWELSGTGEDRQRKAIRLIGWALVALALYLLVQSTWVLATGFHAHHSLTGIAGRPLRNPAAWNHIATDAFARLGGDAQGLIQRRACHSRNETLLINTLFALPGSAALISRKATRGCR
ncbi:hypothetical protein ACWGCW_22865 [Streptomyces sp. NPDC054933]